MRQLADPEGVDPATVEKWRRRLDESVIDDEAFLSCFTIRAKDNSAEGKIREVPFVLLPAQERLHRLEDQVEFGLKEYLEVHVPKSRQHGVSSHTLARFGFARILRRAGYVVYMTAHKMSSTQVHRRLLRRLCKQVDWDALAALGYTIAEDTATSFAVEHPGGMISRIEFLTARSEGLGRGEAPNAVLSTERPHYPKEAKKDFFSILGGMATVCGNCWIDESTANGEGDEFHEDCKRARDGIGIGKLLFLAAYENHLSYRPFASEDAHSAFIRSLGDPAYGDPGEESAAGALCLKYQLEECGLSEDAAIARSEEFLNWRRFKIDAAYRGSVEHFHQEEPCTLDEAFLGSGRPVFDHRILRTWGDAADRLTRSGERGTLVEDAYGKIDFMPTGAGPFVAYQRPDSGRCYCWGNDVASGKEFISGTGRSADWTVIFVRDARTGAEVAKLRAHIGTPDAGRMLVRIARWYAMGDSLARGLVELGGGWGDAVVSAVREVEEGAYEDCLMSSVPPSNKKVNGKPEEIIGFQASRPGKALLKLRGEEFIISVGAYKPPALGEAEPVSPWDRETLDEWKAYSYTDRNSMAASTGHDDCVIADLLSLHARARLTEDGDVPLSSRVNPAKVESDVTRALRLQDERLRAEAKLQEAGTFPGY